jgi:DNA-binding NarL/FixJ family response regulator
LTEVQALDPGYSVRLVVADDHPGMLAVVAETLEHAGYTVVARAGDGRAAVDAVVREQPDVAVLDVQMPQLTGIEVARAVSDAAPETAFVFYTAFGDRALLADALEVGARGFVLKEAPLQDLVRAVERVAGGEAYVDPVLAGILVGAPTSQVPALTQREREVLRLLADGRANDAIGAELGISVETVRTHIRKAMAKLDADTRTHAVATALRQSLIS